MWAAGNVCDVMAGVPQSMAAGVGAAAAINMNLLMTDAGRAATSRTGVSGADAFGGAMEAEVSRRVLGPHVHGLESLVDGH
ncbi:hypothetical protein NKH18_02680 [Streptomyces sp. M10(2022)]